MLNPTTTSIIKNEFRLIHPKPTAIQHLAWPDRDRKKYNASIVVEILQHNATKPESEAIRAEQQVFNIVDPLDLNSEKGLKVNTGDNSSLSDKSSYQPSRARAKALTQMHDAKAMALTTLLFPVAPAMSKIRVDFSLYTKGNQQFVAFYSPTRVMTIAQRTIGTTQWRFKELPSKLKWDNHNWVVLALDESDRLHVSGNMHGTPLVYFKAARPLDISSLAPARMIGDSESRVTYPLFLAGPRGALVFYYRHGGSGNGEVIFNTYNATSRAWRRLHDGPLLTGQGRRSPYMTLRRGPGGDYHMVWLWRETPNANSCHDLCYARSADLLRWETAGGRPLPVPITFADTARAVVDPVRPGGGAFNTVMSVGFDAARRAVVAYAKDDSDRGGRTQLHLARHEGGRWVVRAASNWTVRYAMEGTGWFELPLELGPVESHGGRLQIEILHGQESPATRPFLIDPATMRLTGPADAGPAEAALAGLAAPLSAFPGMQVQWRADDGPGSGDGAMHRLRWETLPRNRDRKPRPPYPEPSLLQVVTIAAQ